MLLSLLSEKRKREKTIRKTHCRKMHFRGPVKQTWEESSICEIFEWVYLEITKTFWMHWWWNNWNSRLSKLFLTKNILHHHSCFELGSMFSNFFSIGQPLIQPDHLREALQFTASSFAVRSMESCSELVTLLLKLLRFHSDKHLWGFDCSLWDKQEQQNPQIAVAETTWNVCANRFIHDLVANFFGILPPKQL